MDNILIESKLNIIHEMKPVIKAAIHSLMFLSEGSKSLIFRGSKIIGQNNNYKYKDYFSHLDENHLQSMTA